MKYSTNNLSDLELPLQFTIMVIVEYRPKGVVTDYAPIVMTADPEAAADGIVRDRGWDKLPHYSPKDVWVDGGF